MYTVQLVVSVSACVWYAYAAHAYEIDANPHAPRTPSEDVRYCYGGSDC